MKKKILIIFSIILFLFGLFFGFKFYVKYKVGYTKVYVASRQIPQRSKLSLDDLVEIEVPKDYLKDNVCLKLEDILDKYVKLSFTIPKDSLIYKTALEENINDLANTLLLENEVNYDIYLSDVKINTANLNKNMFIDLYLTINNKDILISDLLIENARITGLYDSNYKLINDYDKEKVYVLSIAVKKEYVNYLNKARMLGELSSVINNSTYNNNKTSKLNTSSVLLQYLQ